MAVDTFNENGIDKSIGFLLLGVAIFGFFILMIIGLGGVEQTAQSASDNRRDTQIEERPKTPAFEIGQ